MKKINSKLILLLALLLAMSLAVAGCGGNGAAPDQDQAGNDQPQAAKEKVLVWGRGGDASGLDPSNVTDGESAKVTINMYEGLVAYKQDSTEVIPALAKDWKVSEDGKTWSFFLREGVKFHDGTDFDAEDVVFNFERWMNEGHEYHIGGEFEYWGYMFGGYPGVVESVKATDQYTVEFTLNKPMATFLANVAMFPFGIASPEAVKEFGEDYFKNPVGTGPFEFVEWVPDSKIVLKKFDGYWGDSAKVDKLVFRSIPDNSARLMELQAGSIDIMDGITPDDVATIKSDDQFQLILRPSMNVGYLAMNVEKEPFDDVKVRRAVNMAINKKPIIDAFFAGLAKPAKNPLPPSLWGYNDAVEDYEYNAEQAKALLAEAGYPNGFKTTLWAMPVPRPYFPQPQKIAEAMQADLIEVGIDAEIVSHDWTTYLKKTESGEHDMAMLGWTGDNGDPDNFLYVLLDKDNAVKGSAGNIAFYKNDEVHDLLIKAQQEMDQEVRADLYKQAQEIIHDDAPWVPMSHSTPPIAAKKGVSGYVPHPTGVESLVTVDKN
ncbi:ABC transporter substrate-binding protein [Metallumcola ferriviriculae]|uniref:ABC transporter substrate-binding protein n=1 Tax=Metallumcola ferriviriculae TaxID=3039180 RepID=A0AAU0UT55_9FIRM|nr:ABC transporter substrate-binding protein [Desulfitibacteraceae bacterium MK1]